MNLSVEFFLTFFLLLPLWVIRFNCLLTPLKIIWLNTYNFFSSSVFGLGDNRVLYKLDSNLWGCDITESFKQHNGEYLELVSSNSNEIIKMPYEEQQCLNLNKYSLALKIAYECQRQKHVLNYLEFMVNGSCYYKIRDSKIKISFIKEIDGLYLINFKVSSLCGSKNKLTEIMEISKIMNQDEVIKVQKIFLEMERYNLPVVTKINGYWSGFNLEDLLSNCLNKFLIVNFSKNGFYLHGDNEDIESHPFLSPAFSNNSETTIENSKPTLTNEAVAENNNLKIKMIALRVFCGIFIYSLTQILLYKNKTMELVTLSIVATVFINLDQFRFKYILYVITGRSKGFFKFIYYIFGQKYIFCGLNQLVPEKIKNYVIIDNSYPVKWGKIQDKVKHRTFSFNKEYIYQFEKCNLYLIIDEGFKVSLKFEELGVISTLEELMDLNRASCLKTILDLIQCGSISGVSVFETKALNIKFIHLASLLELTKMVKNSKGRLYKCVVDEDTKVYSGFESVYISKEEKIMCEFNGWCDDSALAAIKYYSDSFWSDEYPAGKKAFLSLPCNNQTLNKAWFPNLPNKKLKIYLSGASEVLYLTTKKSYYKLDVFKNNKAVDKVKSAIKEKGFKLVEIEEQNDINLLGKKISLLVGIENEGGDCNSSKQAESKSSESDKIEEEKMKIETSDRNKVKDGFELFKEITERINNFKSTYFVETPTKLMIRESEPGGFKGWMKRMNYVAVGSSRVKKKIESEWYKEWTNSDHYKSLADPNNDPGFFKKDKSTLGYIFSDAITLSNKLTDLRLYHKDFLKGKIKSKNKTFDIIKDSIGSKITKIEGKEGKTILTTSYEISDCKGEFNPEAAIIEVRDGDVINKKIKLDIYSKDLSEINTKIFNELKRKYKTFSRKIKLIERDNKINKNKLKKEFFHRKVIIPSNFLLIKFIKNYVEILNGKPIDRKSLEDLNLPILTRNRINIDMIKSSFTKHLSLHINKKLKIGLRHLIMNEPTAEIDPEGQNENEQNDELIGQIKMTYALIEKLNIILL